MLKITFKTCIIIVSLCTALLACKATVQKNTDVPNSFFSKDELSIPFPKGNRRKWDNPVIADLDQDGRVDIIVTAHAHQATIFWNNGKTFSEAQVLIKGDTHGIAVADYDKDGRIDIIVSQGGGGGKNPRLPVRFQVNKDRSIESLGIYKHFERSRGRAIKFVDIQNNGELDLITSAFPLDTQKQGGNFLYKQNSKTEFEFVQYLPFAKWLGYKVLVTDINNDNDQDVFFYGGTNIVAVLGQQGATFENQTKRVLGENTNINDVSSMSAFDYDNDGDLDLFLTRAKHQFYGHTYYDPTQSRFSFFARGKEMKYEDLLVKGDLVVKNLQMAFPNFDVFIGQNKKLLNVKTSDSNVHRDFSLSQEQAKGFPQNTKKPGLYIGYVGNNYWRIGGLTKSPTSAVIENVLNNPTVNLPEELPAKLLENRNGKFVDVTSSFGINVKEQTSSAVTADFDNDGWIDILVIKEGDSAKQNQQVLYKNIDGKKFVMLENHGIVSNDLGATGNGAEGFDYDMDGDVDVLFGSQRGTWHLYKNNNLLGSNNNFITLQVLNSPDKKVSPQSASIEVRACAKIFKRVVGNSSTAFSHSMDTNLHIGLGSCKKIDSAKVVWSNNETQIIKQPMVNKFVKMGRAS